MKRDLDLIREILAHVERYEPASMSSIQGLGPADFSGTEPQNRYHVRMLIDADFLKEAGRGTMDGTIYVHGLTMQGHDFLDAVREKSIWERTKARLSAAGGWTLDLALEVAKEEVKRRIMGGGQ
jgi:hypothetical protein